MLLHEDSVAFGHNLHTSQGHISNPEHCSPDLYWLLLVTLLKISVGFHPYCWKFWEWRKIIPELAESSLQTETSCFLVAWPPAVPTPPPLMCYSFFARWPIGSQFWGSEWVHKRLPYRELSTGHATQHLVPLPHPFRLSITLLLRRN